MLSRAGFAGIWHLALVLQKGSFEVESWTRLMGAYVTDRIFGYLRS
jgi:hypothetical protein